MTAPKDVQEKVFRRQIQLSKDLDLPFVVHTRCFRRYLMASSRVKELVLAVGSCILSQEFRRSERFMDLGMMISFSGVVTFKKATDVQEAAAGLPLDKILD